MECEIVSPFFGALEFPKINLDEMDPSTMQKVGTYFARTKQYSRIYYVVGALKTKHEIQIDAEFANAIISTADWNSIYTLYLNRYDSYVLSQMIKFGDSEIFADLCKYITFDRRHVLRDALKKYPEIIEYENFYSVDSFDLYGNYHLIFETNASELAIFRAIMHFRQDSHSAYHIYHMAKKYNKLLVAEKIAQHELELLNERKMEIEKSIVEWRSKISDFDIVSF